MEIHGAYPPGRLLPLVAGQMKSEADVQAHIRLLASRAGGRLWRNSVGAGILAESGSFVRWGLANDTSAMNKQVKSGDLIGIIPVLITAEHVGTVIGQFVSREVKREGWTYKGGPHEEAQQRWIDLVRSLGGDAAFTTGEFP